MQIRFIRAIDDLFLGVPHSRRLLELKEEMVQNLMEKFRDLIAQGKKEEDAFLIAMESIGELTDLKEELRREDPFYDPEREAIVIHEEEGEAPTHDSEGSARTRSASTVATAIMLFILCPVPLFLFRSTGMGVTLLFFMVAAGVGLLIFNGMTAPRLSKGENPGEASLHAEDPPETPIDRTKAQKKLYAQLSSTYWLLVTAFYILISFRTMAWHITWVVFLFAPAVESLAKIILKPNPRKLGNRLGSAIILSSIGFFFIISFRTGNWAVSWVLILLGVALSNMAKAVLAIRGKDVK